MWLSWYVICRCSLLDNNSTGTDFTDTVHAICTKLHFNYTITSTKHCDNQLNPNSHSAKRYKAKNVSDEKFSGTCFITSDNILDIQMKEHLRLRVCSLLLPAVVLSLIIKTWTLWGSIWTVMNTCDTGHPVSPDDFTILSSSSFNSELLVRESLLIRKLNPSLNANMGSFPLSLF